jgi:hypothetical protein
MTRWVLNEKGRGVRPGEVGEIAEERAKHHPGCWLGFQDSWAVFCNWRLLQAT